MCSSLFISIVTAFKLHDYYFIVTSPTTSSITTPTVSQPTPPNVSTSSNHHTDPTAAIVISSIAAFLMIGFLVALFTICHQKEKRCG